MAKCAVLLCRFCMWQNEVCSAEAGKRNAAACRAREGMKKAEAGLHTPTNVGMHHSASAFGGHSKNVRRLSLIP